MIAKMDGTKNDHASIKVCLGCGKLSVMNFGVISAISAIDMDSRGHRTDFLFPVLLVQLQAFPTILFYPAGKKTEDPVRRVSQMDLFIEPRVGFRL